MHSLIRYIEHLSQQPNGLLHGAFLMGALGYVVSLLRGAWSSICARVAGQFIVSVEIRNDGDLFHAVLNWLNQSTQARRFRLMHASLDYRADSDLDGCTIRIPRHAQLLFSPAPGNHFVIERGRLLWIERERTESQMSKDWRELLTIRMFTRDPEHLRAFIREIADLSREPEDTQIGVYSPRGEYWARIQSRSKRALESVILPTGQAERLLRDCECFLGNGERYELLGLNHRRGYLFHGVPGAGKTSLVVGLASALGKDVYFLSLGGGSFSDERLLGLLSRVAEGAIVLLEDVDALFVGREKATAGGLGDTLTFSGLLNALDGVASTTGTMLFMTTNHLEKLDPALIRPGRIDVRVEFTHATYGQALELYQRFFPEADAVEAESFARWGGDGTHSMAELQEALIEQWLVDPEPAQEPVRPLAATAPEGGSS